MHPETKKAYLTQLLEGLTTSSYGVYLVRRTDATLVLGQDATLDFGNGLSFDKTLDQVLAYHEYNPADSRFATPDQDGNRYIPLDVAVGSWMRWATNGSHEAILLLNNLAISGLIRLIETALDGKANSV